MGTVRCPQHVRNQQRSAGGYQVRPGIGCVHHNRGLISTPDSRQDRLRRRLGRCSPSTSCCSSTYSSPSDSDVPDSCSAHACVNWRPLVMQQSALQRTVRSISSAWAASTSEWSSTSSPDSSSSVCDERASATAGSLSRVALFTWGGRAQRVSACWPTAAQDNRDSHLQLQRHSGVAPNPRV